jgi:hypothetical protein
MRSRKDYEKGPLRKPLYFLATDRSDDEIKDALECLLKSNEFDITVKIDQKNLADFILVDLDEKPQGYMNYINGDQPAVYVDHQFVVFYSLKNECQPQTINDICDAYNCEPDICNDPDQLKKNICWLRAMSPFYKERRKNKRLRPCDLEKLLGYIKEGDSI